MIPTLKKAATSDIDRRRFLRSGLDEVQRLFEENASRTSAEEPRIQVEIEMRTSTDMRAELYVDGKRTRGCRVWLGGLSGENSMAFHEGQSFSDNAFSEILSVVEKDGLAFSATMAMTFSQYEREHDLENMTAEEVADYLWHRFTAHLSN